MPTRGVIPLSGEEVKSHRFAPTLLIVALAPSSPSTPTAQRVEIHLHGEVTSNTLTAAAIRVQLASWIILHNERALPLTKIHPVARSALEGRGVDV